MHYSFDNSVSTTASAKAIWNIWSDVNNWGSWDAHTLEAKLKGEFADGTLLYLKPKGAPAGDNVLSNVVLNKTWTSTSSTPFGKLIFSHTITDNGTQRTISEHLDANGLIAPLFKTFWAKARIAAGKETLDALAKKAESA